MEFVRLYRAVSADLAWVRTSSGNWQLLHFLNKLVGQAYGVLYRAPLRRLTEVVRESLLVGARTVRQLKTFVFLSLAIILCAATLSATILRVRPELRHQVVSPMEEPLFKRWQEGEFDPRSTEENTMMWAFYAANNPLVTILTVARGAATFGLGSFEMNWRLGMQLGALSSDMARVGKLGFLYSSLIPHGASELSGAVLSSAAGLNMGWAVIAPGRRTRGRSLREAAKSSFVLFVMALLMMFIAAPFEAFFSFNPSIPQWLKTVLGLVILGGWLAYWISYGREDEAEKEEGRLARPTRGLEGDRSGLG